MRNSYKQKIWNICQRRLNVHPLITHQYNSYFKNYIYFSPWSISQIASAKANEKEKFTMFWNWIISPWSYLVLSYDWSIQIVSHNLLTWVCKAFEDWRRQNLDRTGSRSRTGSRIGSWIGSRTGSRIRSRIINRIFLNKIWNFARQAKIKCAWHNGAQAPPGVFFFAQKPYLVTFTALSRSVVQCHRGRRQARGYFLFFFRSSRFLRWSIMQ